MRNKIFHLIITICIMFNTGSLSVFATHNSTENKCGENLIWEFENGTLTISGQGEMQECSFDDAPWYSFKDDIKKIIIEDGVEKISFAAFTSCSNLENIVFPNTLKIIEEYAFDSCTSLINVTIPDNVEVIGIGAFDCCTSITTFDVSDSNMYYSSDENGVLYNKDKTKLIQYPSGRVNTQFIIPDTVIDIEADAFDYCSNLTDIIISESVESIGDFAFFKCENLKRITIPENVISIGRCVFYYCTELNNVNVSENNMYYSSDENGILYDKEKTDLIYCPVTNGITHMTIPDSIVNIAERAFCMHKSLKDVQINGNVKNIDDFAFSTCTSLNEITVSQDNSYYSSDKNGILYNKEKTELILCPAGTNCTEILIPESVTNMRYNAFYSVNKITKVVIPDTVTNIRYGVFHNCVNLTEILIPESIERIEEDAFKNCGKLSSVYYCGSESDWENIRIESLGNEYLLNAQIYYNYNVDDINLDIQNNIIAINSSDDIEDISLIMATHNSKGELVSVKLKNDSIKAGRNNFSGLITDFSEAETATVMVWDNMTSLKPLFDVLKTSIK